MQDTQERLTYNTQLRHLFQPNAEALALETKQVKYAKQKQIALKSYFHICVY